MDFTTIGTLGSYIKQKNLTFAANYKIKTGQRLTNANGNLISTKTSMFDQLAKAQKQTNEKAKQEKVSSIKNKLMSGQKISSTELNYLRENAPELYKKAKHADDAREELKAALKKAKTKQEARQAVTQAMMKASAETSAELAAYKNGLAGGGGGVISSSSVGENISAGVENSAANIGAENISAEVSDSQSLADVNENIQAAGEEMTQSANEVIKIELANAQTSENVRTENSTEPAEENQPTAENSSTQEKISEKKSNAENIFETKSEGKSFELPDILEKYIMTIRALENEWASFAKSDEYKNLPEDIFDDDEKNKNKPKQKTVSEPNSHVTEVVSAYRNSMMYATKIA